MSNGIALYESAAYDVCVQLMRRYSTSFGLASRLLDADMERHIAAIYAMVRVADEIVDGTAAEAGCSDDRCAALLETYRVHVIEAIGEGFSTDPVVHAFAATARRHRIGTDLVDAFFRSMHTDTGQVCFQTERELDDYVYGSAEVVGLMCFAVFVVDTDLSDYQRAVGKRGARALGSAFQRVNFLRDFGHDTVALGRRYLPTPAGSLTDEVVQSTIDRIDQDLATARAALPVLPRRPRAAVASAADLFSELTDRLRGRPAAHIESNRIRIPDARKMLLVSRAVVRSGRG